MSNLMNSNIFFFITSVSVVLITILFVIGLIYVIRILKNIKKASELLKSGVKNTIFSADLISKLFFSETKKKTRKTTKSKVKNKIKE
jgi:hypothetical protein